MVKKKAFLEKAGSLPYILIILLMMVSCDGQEQVTSRTQTVSITATARSISPTNTPNITYLSTLTSSPTKTNTPSPTIALKTDFLDVYDVFSKTHQPIYGYEILDIYPHDRKAFTQGLIYLNGFLYESTGRFQQSSLRKVDLESGNILKKVDLSPDVFGEGLTALHDRFYQLTWKSRTGYIYDSTSLDQIDDFHYLTEGWGITNDGKWLIMSDGSAQLIFLDPQKMAEDHRITVNDLGIPVAQLNELEYVNGYILANVWKSDLIIEIDPDDGQITRWINLEGLLKPEDMLEPVDVLNGIAFNPNNGHLFITGKLWPSIFEIRLVQKTSGHE